MNLTPLSASALAEAPGVRHGFFTRRGGVSEGIFSSLNCGFGSGDASVRVAENRRRAGAALGVAAGHLVTGYQVHGTRVAVVTRPWAPDVAPEADALVTRTPGVALGVLTADCAPVCLADAEARVVGTAHAGWRGAFSGVLEAAVAAMEELGARRRRIRAAVGPCIARGSYEVGTEFRERFVAADPRNARFFDDGAQTKKFFFDLPGYVTARLEALGLMAIEWVARDTLGDEENFFSYRRNMLKGESRYGRGLSAIALEL